MICVALKGGDVEKKMKILSLWVTHNIFFRSKREDKNDHLFAARFLFQSKIDVGRVRKENI
jgi:hypothetical protein